MHRRAKKVQVEAAIHLILLTSVCSPQQSALVLREVSDFLDNVLEGRWVGTLILVCYLVQVHVIVVCEICMREVETQSCVD